LRTRAILLLVALVLLIRLPFLNQAVQGDDVYYLAAAEHAQTDPLHPNHVHYIFEGRDVDFRGYPHPPGNAWVLAALIAVFGEVREVPFHAAYILFSLMAVLGMYALCPGDSRVRFSAALLLLVTPPFLINGNSFESDVPLLGCWVVGAACFMHRRYLLSALLLFASGLIAFQSVLFTPILVIYVWLFARHEKRALAVAFTPVLAIAAWELFEFISAGQFPATVATGYLVSYGYERIAMKLRNCLELAIHFSWLIFPPLLIAAVWAMRKRRDRQTLFLVAWCAIFFAGACAFFYSGSMRYLLPLAPALALLASRLPRRWCLTAAALQACIAVPLAVVNYQHWSGYRDFAAKVHQQAGARRVWVNAEWGLRHYLEAAGGVPLQRGQWVPPGDLVVESELAYPAPYSSGMSTRVPVLTASIAPTIPLRLIGLDAKSGYSSVDKGFLPFDFRGGVIDRVHADLLEASQPTEQYLPMGSHHAERQILSGVYPLENNAWRWIGAHAVFLLKAPHGGTFHANLFIPDSAPARHVVVRFDNATVLDRTLPGPGSYDLTAPAPHLSAPAVTVTIDLDHTFRAPGDGRDLGAVLNAVGFVN
jgi:hypothetical protein